MALLQHRNRFNLFRLCVSAALTVLLLPVIAGTACRSGPGGTGNAPSTPGDQAPRHILLISLDALRADHLGCYGYQRPTSPAMDSLAAAGVLFSRAQVPRGQTWPALTSLLTGRYPLEHGVRDNSIHPGEHLELLPEYLRASGYRTAAFLANFGDAIKSKDIFGLDHLARADVSSDSPQDQWDDSMTDKAVNWITENSDRHTFTWVHLMNPHRPYDPPAAERELLLPEDEYHGWLDDRVSLSDMHKGIREGRIPVTEEQFDQFVHARYWKPWLGRDYLELLQNQDWHLTFDQLLDLIVLQRIDLSEADLAYIHSRYDAEVRAADRCVGRLLETIDRLGLHDDTLVILASDHGDELYDHNHYFFHSASIYQGVLHVPLVLRWPGRISPATTVDSLTEITDLLPTVLEAAGVPLPADIPGRSLLPGPGTAAADDTTLAFAEIIHSLPEGTEAVPPMDGVYSVRDTRWKLLINPSGYHPRKVPYPCLPDRSFPIARQELYDLQRDPGEKQNLLALDPGGLEQAARIAAPGNELDAAEYLLKASRASVNLSSQLTGWLERHQGMAGVGQAQQVSEEVRQRLVALGYVDAEPLSPTTPAASEESPDCERLVRTALQLARSLAGDERAGRLIREAEALLDELQATPTP